MNRDYTEIMDRRTVDELKIIVSSKIKDYEPEAIIAAYRSLLNRELPEEELDKFRTQLKDFESEAQKVDFLSESETCPYCEKKVELDTDEQVTGKFICAWCNKEVNLSTNIKTIENSEYKVDHLSATEICPYCDSEVELSPEERVKGIFTCSFCKKPVNLSHTVQLSGSAEKKTDNLRREGLSKQLVGWGLGLIGLGIAHFIFEGLDTIWGIVIIVFGVASIIFQRRIMFIAIGILLLIAGVSNILVGILDENFGWVIFGIAQLVWAVNEFRKYSKFARITI